jgi:hypothetical protein
VSEPIETFLATARRIVYATLATVDPRGRPRSRIVHPVWEVEEPARRVGRNAAVTTQAREPYAVWQDG